MEKTISKLKLKQDLTAFEMQQTLDLILDGKVDEATLIQFLTLLRDKKESAEEIKGAVISLRKKSVLLPCKTKDARMIDTCGTGGDAKNTFNISTASAFVIAGCGIPVAKHGNRAVSSRSGSADVLSALGVKIDASPQVIARCVDEIGIGFLFAPLYHSTLKVVASARKQIGTKTIFNILGPLLNPVGVKKQVIGVYDKRLLPLVAEVLKDLGSNSVAVVWGHDGLDEITLTQKSSICFLKEGKIFSEEFDPQTFGYSYCLPEDLVGGDPLENARRLKLVLKGHSQPLDHCVHLNAALALIVAGLTDNFKEALLLVQESIASGRAYQKLEQLIEMTQITPHNHHHY